MPFERIDLSDPGVRPEAVVCKAVDALQAGKTVVLPTETVYGLAARATDEAAVRRLVELKDRPADQPMALAFSGMVPVSDFVFEMSELARRLGRRCWPGPVSLVLDVPPDGTELAYLPETVRRVVSKTSTVCFRVPDHYLTSTILGELNEPVVLTSANRSGMPECVSCEEILAQLGPELDLILDDGPLVNALPSTVIRIEGDRHSILRSGAIKEETLRRLCSRMILFVCTGNTCRSPMAERICENILARRLDCPIDRLEEQGFVVLSAGLAAGYDAPASPHAVEALKLWDLDLSDHRSQQLNETHVRFADHILAMTRAHREAILSHWPGVDTRLSVLRLDGGDVSDPIGGPLDEYRACAKNIETEIENWFDRIFP